MQEMDKSRCLIWKMLWVECSVLRELIKQKNSTVDSEETREISEHLAKVTHRVDGLMKEIP